MATRIVAGTYREIWRETTPLAGGGSQVITTGIRGSVASLSNVSGWFIPKSAGGAVSFSVTPSIAGGLLRIMINNTGTVAATWNLDVTLKHSLQQSRQLNAIGEIAIVADGNAASSLPILANIAALRVFPDKSGSVQVLGYYTPGDGGGGDFVWNATSAALDNGGTVILPTGHVGLGRWLRPFTDTVELLWFGAIPDDATDAYTAINAAQNTLSARGCGTLVFPEGDFAVSGELAGAANITWSGVRSNASGAPRPRGTRLRLTAAVDALLSIRSQNFQANGIWFDGGHLATKATVWYPGVTSTTKIVLTDCLISGVNSVTGTGILCFIDGTLQVDSCEWNRCYFIADPLNWGGPRAKVGFQLGTNSQALLNRMFDCQFWGCERGIYAFAGGMTIRHCGFANGLFECIKNDNVPLTIEYCYTEDAGVAFYAEASPSGTFWQDPVILRKNLCNGTSNIVSFNCHHPVVLEENSFNYYVFISPDHADAIYRVRSISTLFRGAYEFVGTGLGRVDETDTLWVVGAGPSFEAATGRTAGGYIRCPGGTPIVLQVVLPMFAVREFSNQELLIGYVNAPSTITLPAIPTNGQVVWIKDATGDIGVNAATVDGNGKTIDGAATLVLSTARVSCRLTYSASLDVWLKTA